MDDARKSDLCDDYADPVRQLLTIGEPAGYDPAEWPNYTATFGIGHEHTSALIRLACDAASNNADTDSSQVWGPMHAWRALGQLRAEAAIAPLLALLKTIEDDDVADREIPAVLGMIGPAAIPHIAAYLSDRSNPEWAAATAMSGLNAIVGRHSECRGESIGIVTRLLEPHPDANPTTTGFAVSALIDLHAVEEIDTIRDAFRRDTVDISIAGDAEDVEIALGLRARRVTAAPSYMMVPGDWSPRPVADRIQRDIAALPRREKVGRNDPCPCGSGKKYKKCCL